MRKGIIEAFAEYTGGGIWLFHGRCEQGFFLMDDFGCVLILDADASDLDVSTYPDWQEEHLIRELDVAEAMHFADGVLDYIEGNEDHAGGMDAMAIKRYRDFFAGKGA